MKILYHHRTLAKDGQDVHITEMIHAFRRAGHEVHIVAPGTRESSPSKKQKSNSTSFAGLMKKYIPGFIRDLLELAYSIRAYFKLKHAYKTVQPDFLYERYNLFTLSGKWLCQRYPLPYVLEVNAPLADERKDNGQLTLYSLAKKLEADCWCAADIVIPVTHVLADSLCGAGVTADKIHVMHNGINPDLFTQAPAPAKSDLLNHPSLKGKVVLGFTGYLRDWHRLDTVILLMATYKGPAPLHLLVLGDGPDVPRCQALAESLGLQDNVSFMGTISRGELASYIRLFDIALQPAVTPYASPLKLFEYMALGKAIIAPDQANIREILTDGEDAILFDTESENARDAAIIRLINDQGLRDRLGQQAQETIDKKGFYWSENAARVIKAVHHLHRP